MDGAHRVADDFGIIVDTKTDTQCIKSSIHNRVQAMSSMLPIVVAPSAPFDVDRDVTIVEGNTRRRMLCKGGRRRLRKASDIGVPKQKVAKTVHGLESHKVYQ